MEKLKMHTPNLIAENIEKLAALFPNCVTEGRNEKGKLTKAIDFDELRQELSDHIVDGPRERYHLDWPGKREALLAANAPIAQTLRPCREESVNFDTTKNLFIEGDNLDALKLLQETYLGKVKVVYIDPPYNTGNDFIYKDDFAEDPAAYLRLSNQMDERGNRLVANTESNGRFHSDWLTMIYARLKLARNLLRDDGAIFISIDDGEARNIRAVCDEIFGEENFVVPVIWQKRITPENRRAFSFEHDYILCYAKSAEAFRETRRLLPLTAEARARYRNPDNDPRGDWLSVPAIAQAGHGTKSQFYRLKAPNGRLLDPPAGCCWRYSENRMMEEIASNNIWFGADGNNVPRIKKFLNETRQGLTPSTMWMADEVGSNEQGKRDLSSLFSGKVLFDSPKPPSLIQRILDITTETSEAEIVIDFFAGSGTSAHAVIAQNARDGGNRRYILVQLPQALNDYTSEETAAAELCRSLGKPLTLAEITKERIRRAGASIKIDHATTAPNLDIGFRVLKIDTSNMKNVYYAPDEVKQDDLVAHTDNIKEDRTPEDLLFQVLVDWGVDLALPIEKQTIAGKSVFFVDGNALAACFDSRVNEDLVKELAARKPLRAVFRDSSYDSDSVKINVEQIFKLLSPETELKSL